MAIQGIRINRTLTRTRDAVRLFRGLPVEDRVKKLLLAEFFQEHKRAGLQFGGRRNAYDQLLGRKRNRRLG